MLKNYVKKVCGRRNWHPFCSAGRFLSDHGVWIDGCMANVRMIYINSYSSWKRACRKCMEDIRPMCKYVMKESGGKVSSSSPTMFCSWKDIQDANFTRVGCQLHLSKHWINAKEYVLTIPPQKAKAAAFLSQPSSASFITIENTPTVKLLKVLVLILNTTQKTWSYDYITLSCVTELNCVCVWLFSCKSSGVTPRLQSLQVESREMERSQVPMETPTWPIRNA